MINYKNIKSVRTPLLTWASALGLQELESGANGSQHKTNLMEVWSKIGAKVFETKHIQNIILLVKPFSSTDVRKTQTMAYFVVQTMHLPFKIQK